MRAGVFVSARVLVQHFVVVVNGLPKLAAAIVDLTQIKLRITRAIGIGVELQVLCELLCRQIILAGVEISHSAVVERVRRGRLGLRVDRYAAGRLAGWG